MLLVGTDIVEIDRIARAIEKEHFRRRVFGVQELAELEARGFPAQSAAVCFCAKEAFGKAMGVGLSGFALGEVQLLHNAAGQPYLSLSGRAEKLAEGVQFAVSAAHSKTCATVVLVGEKKEPPRVVSL